MKKVNSKNFFVAGGTGLVGLNLVKLLTEKKISFKASYFSKYPPKKFSKNFKRYNFLNFKDCIQATKNINTVVICAVMGSNIKSMQNDPAKDVVDNISIRANLLRACYINKVKKVIWVSSSTVYHKKNSPIKESEFNLKKQTHDIYRITGWVYRYLEQLCEFYKDILKLNISIIRTTSIYGLHDNFDDMKSHVVPSLIKKFIKSKSVDVWGNKNVVRDFVFAEDLVKAIYLIANKKDIFIINFSNNRGTSIASLVLELKKIFKPSPKILFKNKSLSSVPYRVLDNTLFNKLFKGFKRTQLSVGLKKTINWYLKDAS